MVTSRRKGFTLIELLTVIAIIAILAGITFSAIPRVLERAKLRKLDGIFHGLEVAMATYATRAGTSGGYPPAYGFLLASARGKATNEILPTDYFTKPYGALIELNKAADIYDNFAQTGDSNRDLQIGTLEFSPIGQQNVANGSFTYYNTPYTGPSSPNLSDEVAAQIDAQEAPVRYVPVNIAQYKRARRYWIEEAQDPLASTWNANSPLLQGMAFPPPKYDAYVLISVGPGGESFDVLAEPPQGAPFAYRYHIAAMRTFFLATRDLNGDNILDLDFRQASSQRGLEYTVSVPNGPTYNVNNLLPSPIKPAGFGPVIFPETPQRIK